MPKPRRPRPTHHRPRLTDDQWRCLAAALTVAAAIIQCLSHH